MRRAIFRFKMWKLRRSLRTELGREPTFGDEFAAMHGLRVEDPAFQDAMAEAFREVTGEEWWS